MARMSAYVEQEDALFALSTVRETLMFAAQLRLSKDMPLEEKEREVRWETKVAAVKLNRSVCVCIINCVSCVTRCHVSLAVGNTLSFASY